MGSNYRQAHLARGLLAYMSQMSQQAPRCYKKVAASSEFKQFLMELSEGAPSKMISLLELALRECAEALRVEQETRISRKRATQLHHYVKNAKRQKVSCPTGEETARQGQEDDEEMLTKKETPGPQSDNTKSDVALAEEPAFEKDKESRMENQEDRDTNAEHPDNGMAATPSEFEIESGLIWGVPSVVDFVTIQLLKLEPSMTRVNFNIDGEISLVWNVVPLLDFFKIGHELYQHLDSREKVSDDVLQARTNWNTSDPSEIFDALEKVKRSTIDNKIHRAYGQMLLFSAVNDEVAKGLTTTASTVHGHRSDHKALLEELARKKAGAVSKRERDQIISSYLYEYQAGQKWLAVIDWFGGSGIILIFVIAGISTWYVETRWTEFQRACVQYIAGLLHSIRRLVRSLGPDALGLYCRHGRLGIDCLEKVKQAEFTRPDKADKGVEHVERDNGDEEDEEDEGVEEEGDEAGGDEDESDEDESGEDDEVDEGDEYIDDDEGIEDEEEDEGVESDEEDNVEPE